MPVKNAVAKAWSVAVSGDGRRYSAYPAGDAPTGVFPLSIHASGRYLVAANGSPFLLHGDTPWSIVAQLTNAQIDTYVADRAAKGFTVILFNAIEHNFTSQTPAYRNVDGVDPFTTMTDFASPNNTYWNRVDYLVNACKAAGIFVLINPAYLGYLGGSEGWNVEVTAELAADLQTYGAWLANRYTQGNVGWCLGGDYAGTTTERNKQWNIVTGIRSVRTTDIITVHGGPGDAAYPSWVGYAGFNLNNCYPSSNTVYTYCDTEYARSGPVPFFMIESRYEQEPNPPVSAQRIRLQAYQALLSGACGHFFGNNPIWHFESPNGLFPYSGTWTSNLNSQGAQDMARVKGLFAAFPWHTLAPTTSLVTSGMSTGDTRICSAMSSSLALIYVPSAQTITVNTNLFTGISGNVRVRTYSPTTGAYATVGTYAKTLSQSIVVTGELVVVIDTGNVTINVAAPSGVAEFNAALAAANDGDTIAFAAGVNVTWTTPANTVNKRVKIQGNGAGRVEGVSRSSLAIGTGSKTFVMALDPGGRQSWFTNWTVGETVRARAPYNSSIWMEGTVTSWNSGTRTLVLNITSTSGTGTVARWVFEMIDPNGTTITCSTGANPMLQLTPPASGYLDLTGIRFIGGTQADGGAFWNINDAAGTGMVRIYGNRHSSGGNRVAKFANSNKGLVRGNWFDAGFNWDNAVNNLVPGYGIAIKGPSSSWTSGNTLGANDTTGLGNVYIEQNFFTGYHTEAGDPDDNARVVWRYNVMDNSGVASHGQDTSAEGLRHVDVYQNACFFDDLGTATANMNYFFFQRGGVYLVHDNGVENINSTEYNNKTEHIMMLEMVRRIGGVNSCYTGAYPFPRGIGVGYESGAYNITGTYIWNNSAGLVAALGDYSTDDCGNGLTTASYVQLNRDYFLRAPTTGETLNGYTPYTYPHPASPP